jgi:hypothetical protein
MSTAASVLAERRCVLHPEREAAVRCVGCRRYYCRECVTENSGRMLCAHCQRQEKRTEATPSSAVRWGVLSLLGILTAWALFYYVGMQFARIPSVFHGGTP